MYNIVINYWEFNKLDRGNNLKPIPPTSYFVAPLKFIPDLTNNCIRRSYSRNNYFCALLNLGFSFFRKILGTRVDSGPATHRHNGEAVGIGTINEGNVANVGGKTGENREAATRKATGLRKNGNQCSSLWYPSGKEQVLSRKSKRRP